MTKTQLRKERLEKHYQLCLELGKLYGSPYLKSKTPGKKISTELMKLEQLAHAGATAYCNGETFDVHLKGYGMFPFKFSSDENAWEKFCEMITKKLNQIFSKPLPGFFVNGDARGYALKCEEGSIPLEGMNTDWGRYQILSPDLND